MSQLSQALILVIQTLGSLYLLIVLLRFILQLVRADFYNPLSQFIVKATHPLLPGSHNPGAQLVSQICEPVLMPFRRLLPNLGGLDISPIFAFLAIKLLDMLVVNNLATMTHMPNILRMLI